MDGARAAAGVAMTVAAVDGLLSGTLVTLTVGVAASGFGAEDATSGDGRHGAEGARASPPRGRSGRRRAARASTSSSGRGGDDARYDREDARAGCEGRSRGFRKGGKKLRRFFR